MIQQVEAEERSQNPHLLNPHLHNNHPNNPQFLLLNKDPSSQPALYEDEGLPQLEPSLISPSRVRVPLHWICAVQNNIERNTYYNILPYHTLYYFYHSPHTTPLPRLGPEAPCPLNFPNSNASILRKRRMIIICRDYKPRQGQTKEKFEHAVFVVSNTSCGGPACFCQLVLWFYTCFTFIRCMLNSMIIQFFVGVLNMLLVLQ